MRQMWSNHQKKTTSHRLFLDLRDALARNADVTEYSRGAGHAAHGKPTTLRREVIDEATAGELRHARRPVPRPARRSWRRGFMQIPGEILLY